MYPSQLGLVRDSLCPSSVIMKNPLCNHFHMILGQYCNKAVLDLGATELMCYSLGLIHWCHSQQSMEDHSNQFVLAKVVGMTVYTVHITAKLFFSVSR